MTNSIEINGMFFGRKEKLKKRMRQLSEDYEGAILPSSEVDFIISFLNKMHPRAQQKIGSGIARIEVRRNNYQKLGFYLIRVDGSESDFNWSKCINFFNIKTGKPDLEKYHKYDVKLAFRHEINDQTAKIKGGRGNTNKETHHAGDKFDDIYKKFIREKNLDPMNIELTGYQDLNEDKSIKDRTLAITWQKYHKENSRLIQVSKKTHKEKHRHRKNREPGYIPTKHKQTTLFSNKKSDND